MAITTVCGIAYLSNFITQSQKIPWLWAASDLIPKSGDPPNWDPNLMPLQQTSPIFWIASTTHYVAM